jgi:hypothetical protein
VVGGQQQVDAVRAAHLAQRRVALLAGRRLDAALALLDRDLALVEDAPSAPRPRRNGACQASAFGLRP